MFKAAFEIRVHGEVPSRLLEDFEGVTATAGGVSSTIRAVMADESELHGVLDALRRAGFDIFDVRRDTDDEEVG